MTAALLIRLGFWLWFFGALAAGHFLLLQRLPPAGVPGVIFGIVAVLLYAIFRVSSLRTWMLALDLRALVLVHLTRFVGIYFLVLHQRGELPYAFAVPAGIGDIVVAVMALPVAFAPLEPASRRRAIVIWNTVGLVDIMLVIASAARINLATPGELRALTQLPLSLLPTFLVPLIIVTHVIIYVRTARSRPLF
jgi:hypothetical protein